MKEGERNHFIKVTKGLKDLEQAHQVKKEVKGSNRHEQDQNGIEVMCIGIIEYLHITDNHYRAITIHSFQ